MKPVLGLASTVLLTLRCGVLYGQSAVEIQVREVVSERDRCVAQEERLAGSRDGVARALVVEERLSEAGLKLTQKGRANLESDVDAMTPEARLAAAREYVSAKPAAASRLGFWAQYQLRTDTSALTVEGLETLRGSLEWRQVMDSTADALIVSRCSNARAEKRKTHGPSAELTREERDRIQTQTREEVGKLLDEGRDELRARFLEATRDSMIAQLRDAKAEIAERKRTGRRADSSFVAATLLQLAVAGEESQLTCSVGRVHVAAQHRWHCVGRAGLDQGVDRLGDVVGRARGAHRAAIRGSPALRPDIGKVHAGRPPCRHRRRQPHRGRRSDGSGQPLPQAA